MGGGGSGVNDHGLALVEQAGAKVVVFVVQEELFVKKLAVVGAHAQQHGGAADKANAGGTFGHGGAAAVPQQVGSAVVDFGLAVGLQQLGRDHGGVGPLGGGMQQLFNRLGSDFAVGVEQQGKRGLHLRQGVVVGGAKAQVGGQRQHLGLGQVCGGLGGATVVAAVVHHDDVRQLRQRLAQSGQAVCAVEGHGDDRDLV